MIYLLLGVFLTALCTPRITGAVLHPKESLDAQTWHVVLWAIGLALIVKGLI